MNNDTPTVTLEELIKDMRKKASTLIDLEEADYDMPARQAYNSLKRVLEAEKKEFNRKYSLNGLDSNDEDFNRLIRAFGRIPGTSDIK